MKAKKSKVIRRNGFVCSGCDFVYCDAPPTDCDCTVGKKTKFTRAVITYKKP